MNTYPLPEEELSPYCRGYWDPNNKKFFHSNSIDVINCCMESCINPINYCFNQCGQKYGINGQSPNFWENTRCHKQCKELIDNCQSGCMEINSTGLTIIRDCAKQSGCGEYPFLTSECLENNRDNIVTCYNKSCVVNQTTDCEHNLGDDFYTYMVNGIKFPLEKIDNVDRKLFVKKEHNGVFYVFSICIFVLVIVGVYIIERRLLT